MCWLPLGYLYPSILRYHEIIWDEISWARESESTNEKWRNHTHGIDNGNVVE
jgi:hypothetical protein